MAAERPESIWKNEEAGTSGPHGDLTDRLQRIRDRQTFRSSSDRLFQQLYCDLRYVGYEGAGATAIGDILDILDGRLHENVIKQLIGTMHSKVDQIRIVPTAVTIGAEWDLQYKAEQMNQYIAGRWAESKVDEALSMSRLHALIYGTGFVKVLWDGKQPVVEYAPSQEIWVDPSEARYSQPRTVWQTKAMPRETLIEQFPDFEEQIVSAHGVTGMKYDQGNWISIDSTDMVVVGEVWHLPPKGRRALFLDNCTLVNDEWKRERMPFARIRAGLRPWGFWGVGVCEDLVGQQLEHNKTLAWRQEAMHFLSAPFVLLAAGSKVVKSKWSNLIGRIIEYVNTPPQVITPEPISQAYLEHGDRVKRSMFDTEGVSQLSATMQKPAGLNSGKAIRSYRDTEGERMSWLFHEAEGQALQTGELLIDEEYEHLKGRGKVLYDGPEGAEIIEFPDLTREQFRLRVLPVSELSTTFAGRVQDVYDIIDLGVPIEEDEKIDLLRITDLKRLRDKKLSQRDLLSRILEQRILRDGKYVEPESFWNLQLGKELAMQLLGRAQLKEHTPSAVPADRLDMLRMWIRACMEKLGEIPPEGVAAEPPVPAPMDPGMLPPSEPGMAPPMPPEGAPMPPPNGAPLVHAEPGM